MVIAIWSAILIKFVLILIDFPWTSTVTIAQWPPISSYSFGPPSAGINIHWPSTGINIVSKYWNVLGVYWPSPICRCQMPTGFQSTGTGTECLLSTTCDLSPAHTKCIDLPFGCPITGCLLVPSAGVNIYWPSLSLRVHISYMYIRDIQNVCYQKVLISFIDSRQQILSVSNQHVLMSNGLPSICSNVLLTSQKQNSYIREWIVASSMFPPARSDLLGEPRGHHVPNNVNTWHKCVHNIVK